MSRPRADVTDAELAVLKELWARGPSTIRQLVDRLYPSGEASSHATVQKLLERLERKGCVCRDASRGRSHVYAAAVERAALIAHRLRETADRLCGGSMTPLLTHLVRASELSDRDLEELRQLVERPEDAGSANEEG